MLPTSGDICMYISCILWLKGYTKIQTYIHTYTYIHTVIFLSIRNTKYNFIFHAHSCPYRQLNIEKTRCRSTILPLFTKVNINKEIYLKSIKHYEILYINKKYLCNEISFGCFPQQKETFFI